MNEEEIENLLQGALSPDAQKRKYSEQRMMSLQEENFPVFVTLLSKILSKEDPSKQNIRFISGMVLRNSLHAKDPFLQARIEQRWDTLSRDLKDNLKVSLFNTLKSRSDKIGSMSAGCVASIARIEIPRGEWPDFYLQLYAMLRESVDEDYTRSILETVTSLSIFILEETALSFDSFSENILGLCLLKLREDAKESVCLCSMKALAYSF
jgi:importin subunit beta-1